MPIVSKPFTFANGAVSDATQVDDNFDTLYNAVNGNLDSANIAPLGIATSNIAKEAVTPSKTEGLVYASDLFGSGYVLNGLAVTQDTNLTNKIDVTAGAAYVAQADGSLRRFQAVASNYTTASASATYYLDFNPDGTWSFATGHSTQNGYLTVATITTDANGNVSTLTQNSAAYQVALLGGAGSTITNVNSWI